MRPQELFDKIQKLPPEKIAVVEDFVEFLRLRDEDTHLTAAATKLSEKSFRKVWDNPDDAEYDNYDLGDIILVPFPFTDQTTVC